MPMNQRLLHLALLLLWAPLLLNQQLQPLTAVGIPLTLGISIRLRGQPPGAWISVIATAVLLVWAALAPWSERSAWLVSLANLVWLMAGLKLWECQRPGQTKRAALVVLIGIGLAGVLSQGLGASLLQGAAALCCFAGLIGVEAGPQPLRPLLKRSLQLVGLALPMVLVAFVLLPRLPVLWRLPGGQTAQTGLSELVRPGDLAQLVQQPGIAARMQFTAAPPPPAERYWRVLVHRQFDGSGWSPGPPEPLPAAAPTAAGPISDRWLVEPTDLPWRPWDGSGVPVGATPLTISRSGGLWAAGPALQRQVYAIAASSSGSRWRWEPPTASDLAVPPGSNPRLEQLALRWRASSTDPSTLLQMAQQWYQAQGFRYSLEPGALPATAPLDAFLFERRAGFCEHFASSFAALMRAAGVPARVITGYQGGTLTQAPGGRPWLSLAHSDAHAWSEIWLPDQGWVEVDPTAWVAPDRVRLSLRASLSSQDRARMDANSPPPWLQQLSDGWQLLDSRWQLWVMQFDSSHQRQWLPPWIQGAQQGWIAMLVAALALGISVALAIWSSRSPEANDRQRQALERSLAPLRRLQLEPAAGETLQEFGERVQHAAPDLAAPLRQIIAAYNRFRFTAQPRDIPALERTLNAGARELARRVRRRKGAS